MYLGVQSQVSGWSELKRSQRELSLQPIIRTVSHEPQLSQQQHCCGFTVFWNWENQNKHICFISAPLSAEISAFSVWSVWWTFLRNCIPIVFKADCWSGTLSFCGVSLISALLRTAIDGAAVGIPESLENSCQNCVIAVQIRSSRHYSLSGTKLKKQMAPDSRAEQERAGLWMMVWREIWTLHGGKNVMQRHLWE